MENLIKERQVILDSFDKKGTNYVNELIHESLVELFCDEKVDIKSYSWQINVTVSLEEKE